MKYLVINNFEMIVTALVTITYMYNLLSTETIVPVGNQLDRSVVFRRIIDCTDSINDGNCFENYNKELVKDVIIPNTFAQYQWESCLDVLGDTNDISLLLKIQNCYHQADLVKHAIDTNKNDTTNKNNFGWFWKLSTAFNLVIQIAIVLYLIQASDNHHGFRGDIQRSIKTLTDTIKGVERQTETNIATTTRSDIGFNHRIKEIEKKLSTEGDIGGDLKTLSSNYSAVQGDLNMLKFDYFATFKRQFVPLPPIATGEGAGSDKELDSPIRLDQSGLASTPSSPPTPFCNLSGGFPPAISQLSPIKKNKPKKNKPKKNKPKFNKPKINKPKIDEPKTDEPKTDEPKADEQKINEPTIDEPKTDEPKIDEQKIAEQKIAEPTIAEQTIDEQKIDEPKADEQEIAEPKADEPKADEQEIAEPKADEQEIAEPKIAEPTIDEPKIDEPKTDEQKIDEPKTDEQKIAEPKTDEQKIAEPKTDEQKIEESKIEESKIDEKIGESGIGEPQEDLVQNDKPKMEEPKMEEPKLEEPKLEEPKMEEPKDDKPQKGWLQTFSHQDNFQKNNFKPDEWDRFDNQFPKLTAHAAAKVPCPKTPRQFCLDEELFNKSMLDTSRSAIPPSGTDSFDWQVRYRDVNKINPSTNKKYKKVMVPSRGWMSIKVFEAEENLFGSDGIIINQSLLPTL